jgi:hypothetical protein
MCTQPLFYDHTISENGIVTGPNGIIMPFDFNRYAGVCIHGRKYYVHRLLAHVFVPNPRPDIFTLVDHIDRDKTNNSISNLRWSNYALNGLNTDAKNAYFVKKWKKWHAKVRGKTLGYYKTFEKAHEVSKKYRINLLETSYKDLCENTQDSSSMYFVETRRCPTLAF